MSRVVVTGGSGFIGANLVEALLGEGQEVLNLDIAEPQLTAERQHWIRTDILDRDALRTAVRRFKPDTLFHLAARTDLNGSKVEDYAANTVGVANLIEAAGDCDSLQRIILASSRLVCRIGFEPKSAHDYLPTTPYGESKVAGEKLVYAAQNLRATWTIVRPTSIWGPRFNVPYRNFFDAVRKGRYLHPRGHKVHKSFGYVGNTVTQLRRLVQVPVENVAGRMFYLADYEPIEVLDWGSSIARASGAPPIREVPVGLLRTLARAGDGLVALGWRSAPLTTFRLENLMTQMIHDMRPLRDVCGPLPTSMLDGVAATVRWMRAQ
jgi:nucleoside-diphosphate-sugar epimerase